MKRLVLLPFALALALGAASPTLAQAPSAAPSASTGRASDRTQLERQRDEVLKRLRERGLPLGSAPTPLGSAPNFWPSASAAPRASGAPSAAPLAGTAAELARRWRAFAESRLERRERHRAALVRDLGQRLSDPSVKDELKLHATRMAELGRIQFLAENARQGADREKLLARVTKLTARESARHQRQMARLTAAARSASAAPSSSGAPR
jgi:hypothetical protein